MKSSIINAESQLNLLPFIAEIAAQYGFRTPESVQVIEDIHYSTMAITSSRLRFFHQARTPDTEFMQKHLEATMAPGQYFVAMGIRAVILTPNGVADLANNYDINGYYMRDGINGSTLYKGIESGRVNVKCGDATFLKDYPLTAFQTEYCNPAGAEDTFTPLLRPVVWASGKKLEFEVELTQEFMALANVIDHKPYMRWELYGYTVK